MVACPALYRPQVLKRPGEYRFGRTRFRNGGNIELVAGRRRKNRVYKYLRPVMPSDCMCWKDQRMIIRQLIFEQ